MAFTFLCCVRMLCACVYAVSQFTGRRRRGAACAESERSGRAECERGIYGYTRNVGAVSFTEDQITELARNIFSLDGFLNNVSVELKSDGEIKVGAKIKDKSALLKQYPELEKYSLLLVRRGAP